MELIKVAQEIESKIKLLETGRKELKDRGLKKAETVAEYEKELGITMLKLRNGAIKTHEGYKCDDLPVTMIEKVAKSICWKSKLEMDKAEVEFKIATIGMQAIQNEMNGYQSIHRYQTEIGD